jgi:hypothetical protein
MGNVIDRKTAEAARRRVLEIDKQADDLSAERGPLVQLWNEFCCQEQARLDAKSEFAVYETYRKLGWN